MKKRKTITVYAVSYDFRGKRRVSQTLYKYWSQARWSKSFQIAQRKGKDPRVIRVKLRKKGKGWVRV